MVMILFVGIIQKTISSFIGAFQAYSGDSISEIKSLEMSEVA